MKASAQIIPTITAGIVMGIVELLILISFATLIFSGELEYFVGQGIGIFILTGVTVMTITTLRSSIVGSFGSVQDVTSVVLAVIAAHIATSVSDPTADSTYYTVLAAIGINTFIIGITFYLITHFNLTDIIRSLPYPVIGGLIAGSGWLLFTGGLDILTDGVAYADYLQSDTLLKWVPGLAFALVLFFGLRRYSHYLVMPTLLVGGIVLFYVVLTITGTSPDQAQQDGFLLGPFPSGGLIQPLTPDKFGEVHWDLILGEAGHIVAILAVSAITLILNISGLELILREDADFDRELKTAAVANGISGLFGGAIGFSALSLTTIARRIGANNRIYPLVSAGFALCVLFLGTDLLEYFPKVILGGLLMFLGISFLWEWIVDAYEELPRLEYGMIIAIVFSVGVIGYLEGVVIGIVLAVIAFAYSYSKVDFVRHHFTGQDYHSTVVRSQAEQEYLREHGSTIEIFQLQGFIFFGTANSLYSMISKRVRTVSFLILDCRKVIQLDSSAIYSLQKLAQLCEQNDIELIFTAVSDSLKGQLSSVEVQQFNQLDVAVAYAEHKLLAQDPSIAELITINTLMDMIPPQELTRLYTYMEDETFEKGAVVAKQDELANTMFFVIKGLLGVYLTVPNVPDYRIRTIGEGAVVGEVSAYMNSIRTASIIAEEESKVFIFSHESMERLEKEDPPLAMKFHRQMSHILAQRLTDTTRTLQAALE